MKRYYIRVHLQSAVYTQQQSSCNYDLLSELQLLSIIVLQSRIIITLLYSISKTKQNTHLILISKFDRIECGFT